MRIEDGKEERVVRAGRHDAARLVPFGARLEPDHGSARLQRLARLHGRAGGIDGMEAARRIRALGGSVAATPIVALTANVLSHQRQAYLEAGMDGVVGKPISPGVLLAEISRLARRAEDQTAEAAA